jgi:hypothetical protein
MSILRLLPNHYFLVFKTILIANTSCDWNKKVEAGVSNSNPLMGRISYQRCPAGRTMKEKRLCRPQFLEVGSHIYDTVSSLIWLY